MPGVRDTVSITYEHDPVRRTESIVFHQCVCIGKNLARVDKIRERIDDGHSRAFRQLHTRLMPDGACNDEFTVLRENHPDIVYRFPGCHPDGFLWQEDRVSAELRNANFERHACAERFQLKDKRCSPGEHGCDGIAGLLK